MPLPLRPLLSQNVKAGVNRAKIETIASRDRQQREGRCPTRRS
jgi:hypothetical protein